MAISSPGVGSGLDVNLLVSQLVAAERAPGEQRLQRFESAAKAQISAFGALKSALAGLQGAVKRFDGTGATLGRKATVGADAGFSASAGADAKLGSYTVSVERLATAHKLQSAAVDKATQVGHGQLAISVGSDAPITVSIAEGSGTLGDIRDAINAAAGGKGVTATIVRGDSGDVLSLSSTVVGSAGALTISASGGDGGLGVLATSGGTLTQVAPAQDARVVIDGVVRTASTNTLTDAIDGLTLNLTTAKPGTSFSLDVTADASPLKASLLGFVSAYNTALTQLRTQGAAGGAGKVAGTLSGDSAPRSMTQSLRGTVANAYSELVKLGFKTATDGSLSLDGATFDKQIAADPEAVVRLVGPDAPLGKALRASLESYAGAKGMLENRTTALNERMKALGRDRERFETRMEGIEAAYRRQFTALDSLMSRLQSTSSYLTQQLASLSRQTNSN